MAGYSGTPLPKKLGVIELTQFATKHAPEQFAATLGPLPAGAEWRKQVRPGLDVVVAFYTSRASMVREWPKLTAAVAPNGTVWIAWPKRASGVATDITEDVLREEFLPTGWVDNKVCAIDDTWSALRFAFEARATRGLNPTGSTERGQAPSHSPGIRRGSDVSELRSHVRARLECVNGRSVKKLNKAGVGLHPGEAIVAAMVLHPSGMARRVAMGGAMATRSVHD